MGNCMACKKVYSRYHAAFEFDTPKQELNEQERTRELVIAIPDGSFFAFISRQKLEDLLKDADIKLKEKASKEMTNLPDISFPHFYFRKTHVRFEKNEEGNNLHNYIFTEVLAVSPKLALFFDINSPSFDPAIEFNRILNWEKKNEHLVIFAHLKSKKILMINPRQYYTIRVIKRVGDQEYLDFMSSVEILGYQGETVVQPHIEQAAGELASIHHVAMHWRGDENYCVKSCVAKSDPKSGTGLLLAKPFIISHLKSVAKIFKENFDNFYVNGGMKSVKEVVWFDEAWSAFAEQYERQEEITRQGDEEIIKRSDVNALYQKFHSA